MRHIGLLAVGALAALYFLSEDTPQAFLGRDEAQDDVNPNPRSNPFRRLPVAPRGIRNNNPGNLELPRGYTWQGQVDGDDPRFATFESPEYGIRAILRTVNTYQSKYGLATPREIINRWAPPTENDTNSYVNHVAEELDVSPDDRIHVTDRSTGINLARTIVQHENGQDPYPPATYDRAYNLAFTTVT